MWTSSMPSLQRKREVGPPNVEGLSPWVRSLAWRYFLSRKIVGAIETLIAWTGNSRVELQRPRRLLTSLPPVALPLQVCSPSAQRSIAHCKASPAAQCDCAMFGTFAFVSGRNYN